MNASYLFAMKFFNVLCFLTDNPLLTFVQVEQVSILFYVAITIQELKTVRY